MQSSRLERCHKRGCCAQSDRFKLPDKTYKAQYAQMYYARLMELSTSVQKAAKEKWPSHNSASAPPDA